MICNTCNKIMGVSGTRYECKRDKNGNKQFLHKRYCECKNCKYRKYTNSLNFQQIVEKEVIKNKK